jgi:hypothetical protein
MLSQEEKNSTNIVILPTVDITAQTENKNISARREGAVFHTFQLQKPSLLFVHQFDGVGMATPCGSDYLWL